jgi:hypothetical protein
LFLAAVIGLVSLTQALGSAALGAGPGEPSRSTAHYKAGYADDEKKL